MAECNNCGKCCNPIQLSYTPAQLKAAGPMALEHYEDYEFVLTALERIPYREGIEKLPHLRQPGIVFHGLDKKPTMSVAFYKCKYYDEENLRCSNYENRPPMCSGYPWYGKAPKPTRPLPYECSFNEDVGREVKVTISSKGG